MSRFKGSIAGLTVAVVAVAWYEPTVFQAFQVGLLCGWLGYLIGWIVEVRDVSSGD